MRRDGIPSSGWRPATRSPISTSLPSRSPYEQLYTNVLTMLDLAQIPLRATDRNASHLW